MAFWNVPNRVVSVQGENGFELYGDFQCDSVSDLTDKLDGVTIAKGSVVQIVQADDATFLTKGSDGIWYPEQSGSSKNSLNASLSMSPTLNKAITDSKDDMIELTEDDIDRISDELEQAETPVKEQKKVFEESIEEPEKDGDDDAELL